MKRMIVKTVGIALVTALMLPAAAFAAPKTGGPAVNSKQVIREQRQADKLAVKEQRQADKLAMKDMTPEERKALREQRAEERKARIAERKATQAEKRAAVKAKVKEHRIKKLEEIKAKKEANGSTDTPAYQRIVDMLNKLLGTNG